jgi:hypothetical protein
MLTRYHRRGTFRGVTIYPTKREAGRTVRLMRLSASLYEQLGQPERITVSFEEAQRRLWITPSEDENDLKVTHHKSPIRYVASAEGFLQSFGLDHIGASAERYELIEIKNGSAILGPLA